MAPRNNTDTGLTDEQLARKAELELERDPYGDGPNSHVLSSRTIRSIFGMDEDPIQVGFDQSWTCDHCEVENGHSHETCSNCNRLRAY